MPKIHEAPSGPRRPFENHARGVVDPVDDEAGALRTLRLPVSKMTKVTIEW